MKKKSIEIDGNKFEVRELTMEEGLPLMSSVDGNVDIAGLIRIATTINGKPAKQGDISMGQAVKLMPVVMELNNFTGAEAGNE